MTQQYEGSPGIPNQHIPSIGYDLTEGMIREMQGERTQSPQGLWLPNTVQATWEIGKRWGSPQPLTGNLDIFGQNAFLPGPGDGRRWLIVFMGKAATTGNSRIVVAPRDITEAQISYTLPSTAEVQVRQAYPGLMIENDGIFGGGAVGLTNSGNAADTAIAMTIIFYELVMGV